MRAVLPLCAAFCAMLLEGCATITSGTTQAMAVDTGDVTGADCVGVDKVGRKFNWNGTPASTSVRKGDGPMTISCSKQGHPPASVTVHESLTTNTFGNVLIGGLIGAGIDAASGAAQKYPDAVTVPMQRGAGDSASSETPPNQSISARLQELDLRRESGTIGPEEYAAQRRALLEKL